MKVDVILISGKQGSGKSTLSAVIRNRIAQNGGPYWQACELIFAGAIYQMHDYCRQVLKDSNIAVQPQKDGKLLQLLGTEWGRGTIDENVWVDVMRGQIQNKIKLCTTDRLTVVIPDCRFKNEFGVWPDALKVRLECEEYLRKERCSSWRDNTAHPSEVDLDDWINFFELLIDSGRVGVEAAADAVFGFLNTRHK